MARLQSPRTIHPGRWIVAEDQAMREPVADVGSEPKLPFPLQDNEAVLVLARRHWIYLWPNVVLNLAIAIVPVLIVSSLFDKLGINDGKVFWIIAVLWIVFWAARAYLEWYRFHHDIWVITNQRLVDAYKKNPFNLRVSSADLVNVQDMSVERHGILGTALDYGDVLCQTAGTSASFLITGVPNPRGLQARLDKERDRERMRGSRFGPI
jgi:hypothetical protein